MRKYHQTQQMVDQQNISQSYVLPWIMLYVPSGKLA